MIAPRPAGPFSRMHSFPLPREAGEGQGRGVCLELRLPSPASTSPTIAGTSVPADPIATRRVPSLPRLAAEGIVRMPADTAEAA